MPRKRKSDLSKNSSRARAAKVARGQESSVHAKLRRQQQAQRQSILRAAETPLQARVRSETQAELQAARRAIETPESQARKIHIMQKCRARVVEISYVKIGLYLMVSIYMMLHINFN
ncbi:hypothetical protein TNCV_4990181 [Trichonephila clavipes]|uniref:Uncharacterized protein n=1 Tax=Trichonephila clavipes TaxID=2585209 RepID=A0A8X7BIA4_TRICX|nr:hypothetical protein TNCV_4990181 [Trichonephila clavipes]